MGRLDNKVAIVTGAGRGLGKGIAMQLALEGAKVVVADMAPADEAVAEIEAAGGTATTCRVNVAKQEEVQALVEYAVKTYGTLDIMVNNAGINRDGMLHKMSVENWDTVIAVALTGTFYGANGERKNHQYFFGKLAWKYRAGKLCSGKSRSCRTYKDRSQRECQKGNYLQCNLSRLY